MVGTTPPGPHHIFISPPPPPPTRQSGPNLSPPGYTLHRNKVEVGALCPQDGLGDRI